MKQEEEKEGLDVIEKLKANLERFKSAAGDKILKYKEFWKENEECKEKFDEEGSIYKLFDSDYVAGVLNLPDKALSEEEIDAQIEEVDKEKEGEEGEEKEGEEKEEEKEEEEDEEEEEEEEEEKQEVKESLNEEEGLDLDLDLDKPEEEETELGGEEETPEFAEPEGEEGTEVEGEGDETFSEEPEVKEFFAVFDMSGEREEVFRTDNPSVIKAFQDFFENSFKACMKEQILKFKQAQEDKRKEAELKAEQKRREEQKEKLDKFMKA